MRPKFTMAIAVLTVALMIGCAFVPLASFEGDASESSNITYNDTKTSAEVSASDIATPSASGYSLGEILSLLMQNKADFSVPELDLGEIFSYLNDSTGSLGSTGTSELRDTLIPVNNDTDYTQMTLWDGQTVNDNRVVGLYGGNTITVGKYESSDVWIEAGSTLVLFPVKASGIDDYSFTLESYKGEYYYTRSINLEDGSYLDIFGLKFRVLDMSSTFHLTSVTGKVIFDTEKSNGGIKVNVEIGADSAYESIVSNEYLYNNTDVPQTADDAAVKFSATGMTASDDNALNLTGVSYVVDALTNSSGSQTISINISTESVSLKNTPISGTDYNGGTLDVVFSAVAVNYTEKEDSIIEEQISNMSVPAGTFSMTITTKDIMIESEKSYNYKLGYVLTNKDTSAQLSADRIIIDERMIMDNIAAKLGKETINVSVDNLTSTRGTSIQVEGECAVTVNSIKYENKGSDSNLGTASYPNITINNLQASVSDLTFNYEEADETPKAVSSSSSGSMVIDVDLKGKVYLGADKILGYNLMGTGAIGTEDTPMLTIDGFGLSVSGLKVTYNSEKIDVKLSGELELKATKIAVDMSAMTMKSTEDSTIVVNNLLLSAKNLSFEMINATNVIAIGPVDKNNANSLVLNISLKYPNTVDIDGLYLTVGGLKCTYDGSAIDAELGEFSFGAKNVVVYNVPVTNGTEDAPILTAEEFGISVTNLSVKYDPATASTPEKITVKLAGEFKISANKIAADMGSMSTAATEDTLVVVKDLLLSASNVSVEYVGAIAQTSNTITVGAVDKDKANSLTFKISLTYPDMVIVDGFYINFNGFSVAYSSEEIDVVLGGFSIGVNKVVVYNVPVTNGTEDAPVLTAEGFGISVTDLSVKYVPAKDATPMKVTVKLAGEFKIEAKSILVAGGISSVPVENLDLTSSITAEDLLFSVKNVSVEYVGAIAQTEAAITVGAVDSTVANSVTVGGSITVPFSVPTGIEEQTTTYKYKISADGTSISGVTFKMDGNGITAAAEQIKLSVGTKYDGIFRAITADASGLEVSVTEKTVGEETANVIDVKAKEVNASCNIPFRSMGLGELFVNFNIDLSVSGSNIAFLKDTGISLKGDSIAVTSRTPADSTPFVEELYVKADMFSIDKDLILKADAVSGHFKNFGEDKQAYTITGAEITVDTQGNAITILKGNAEFAAGFLPSDLIVAKDVTFKANGLSAVNFKFADGSVVSGTIALDTAEYVTDESRAISYGEKNIVTLKPVNDKALSLSGYKMTLDIGTKVDGKLYASNGTMIPAEWKAEYGTQPELSSDGKSATFVVPADGAVFCFETEPLTYTFAYDGEDAVQKKYGETVKLKAIPDKEGFIALGWSDGSGLITAAESDYTMPARNVVLKASYSDAAPKEVIVDKDVSVNTDKSTSVVVSSESLNKVSDDGTLTIKVVGAEVKMDKKTLDGLRNEYGGAKDMTLYLSVNKADEINDEVTKKIVGSGTLYNIELVNDDGEFAYANNQTFQVKLDVKVNGQVDHFNIRYIDDTSYSTHSVGVTGFDQSSDSNCTIEFECNHFSDYIIEAVYKEKSSTDWGYLAMIIVLIVIVVALVFYAAVRVSKAEKN